MRTTTTAAISSIVAVCGLALTAGESLAQGPLEQPFPSAIRVDELRGVIGFEIQGAVAGEASGRSVRPAGDVNDDGIGDVIVNTSTGDASYVLFGREGGLDPQVPLADLDGDGELTLFDFLAFQNAFDAGCD